MMCSIPRSQQGPPYLFRDENRDGQQSKCKQGLILRGPEKAIDKSKAKERERFSEREREREKSLKKLTEERKRKHTRETTEVVRYGRVRKR